MKKFNKLIGFLVVFIAVLSVLCTVSFAATVGQQLTSPEEGWKRINDNDSHFLYSTRTMQYQTGVPASYNSDYHFSNEVSNPSVTFNFSGTMLRIIGHLEKQYFTDSEVVIDGVSYGELSQYDTGSQGLLFEVNGLSNSVHNVKISGKNTKNWAFQFDAIDIDNTGYLVDINQPTNLIAAPVNTKVDLSWNAVPSATSYNIKRSTTSGGPYTTIATTSAITYTDSTVSIGTTYYYVVSTIVSGTESTNSNEASVTLQASNQLKLVLEVNEQKQLSVSDDLFDNSDMDWLSSDSTIVTVDASGKLKALKPGDTIITCTSKDKSYTEKINVLVVDLEYQLAVDLDVGDRCRLTVSDLSNTTNITWTSYNPTIATVSVKGKITAISEGLTYIVATDKDGKEIGRIYIRVRE